MREVEMGVSFDTKRKWVIPTVKTRKTSYEERMIFKRHQDDIKYFFGLDRIGGSRRFPHVVARKAYFWLCKRDSVDSTYKNISESISRNITHSAVINAINSFDSFDKKFFLRAIEIGETFNDQVHAIWNVGVDIYGKEVIMNKLSYIQLKRACAEVLSSCYFVPVRNFSCQIYQVSDTVNFDYDLYTAIKKEYERILFQDR